MEPLRIHLFGGFLLEQGSRTLPPIPSRAGRSLFAYLVTNQDRRHQRELLAGTFWPDLPENRARRRLSHVLWQIQDVLGESGSDDTYLLATTDTLAFNTEAPYWLDIEEFKRRAASLGPGRATGSDADIEILKSCVDLYRGDFMAGFYEDWVTPHQEHLRELHLSALTQLVQMTKSRGNHQEALAFARRLTHHDPLREEAHQEVIRLCFLLGRTSEALQQYERCRSVLAEELGAEPSQATIDLYKRILRHRRAGTSPALTRAPLFEARAEAPFVGRENERRLLVDTMEQALSGRGGVILIEGEPGIGKTRLVTEATDDAGWRGFEIIWGRCQVEGSGPYEPLVQALTSGLNHLRASQLAQHLDGVWLAEIARLVPGISQWLNDLPKPVALRTGEDSERMEQALASTLVTMGKIAPHVLIIDDLQWADGETLRVLQRLGQQLSGTRLVIMAAYRTEEARGDARVWDVLRHLDRNAGRARVVLTPLSVFELGEMIKRSLGLGTLEPEVATRFHRETGGNALFVLETLHALRDEGLVDELTGVLSAVAGRRIGDQQIPIPSRIKSVIAQRTQLLDAESRQVLSQVAVAGRAVSLEVLEDSLGLSQPEMLRAIDDLLGRRLLQEADDRYSFGHDQVRQVVYELLGIDERQAAHHRVALAFERFEPQAVDTLAFHFNQAGEAEKASRYLYEAGQAALRVHAYETALRYLSEAAGVSEAGGWGKVNRFRLFAEMDDVFGVLGRRKEQAAILDSMEELAGPILANLAEVARRRALLAAHTDDFEVAVREAQTAVALAEEAGDARNLARSLVVLGLSLRWSGRSGEAVPLLERAIGLAYGDPDREAEARTAIGNTLTDVQQYEAAERHLQRAAEIYNEIDDPRGRAETLGVLAMGLMERGMSAEAESAYRTALHTCTQIGYRHGEGVNRVNLANLLCFKGKIAEALTLYGEAVEVFQSMGNRRGIAMTQANDANIRHAVIGDAKRVVADAQAALQYFTEINDQLRQSMCLDVLANVKARDGDHTTARRMLEEALTESEGNHWLHTQHSASMARLLLDQGEAQQSLGLLRDAEQACETAGLADLLTEVRSLSALALARAGQANEAWELSQSVVSTVRDGVERPYLIWSHHAEIADTAGHHLEARVARGRAYAELMAYLNGLDPAVIERALSDVPENRRIVSEWEAHGPLVVSIELPDVTAPTGRPLRDDESRTVTWTLYAPEDDTVADEVDRRRRRIARMLTEAEEQGALPTVEHLAEALDVSVSTVRRDLNALREEGHQVRTRGRRSA